MKNLNLLLLIMLLCCATGFTQVKVNSIGNTGIGASPNSKAKLLLYNKSVAADTIFGLHSTMNNTSTSLTKPVYGIYSNNTTASASNSLYGAYFKNTLTNSAQVAAPPLYGVYIDNYDTRFAHQSYGVYTNNISSGYSHTMYGYYANNTNTSASGQLYGFYANNTSNGSGNAYGVYLNNNMGGSSGNVYGIYSTNTINPSAGGSVYGAYFSATSLSTTTTTTNAVYGIYSTVSGGNANSRYAGYFTGGKVVVMNGSMGIGKDPASGRALDVNGNIYASGTITSSDERLKTEIKPLSDEKEKLYLLQGKSYKKTLQPSGFEEDSLAEKREVIEFPEYGYLAQELREIFPDLVTSDSTDYYGINYIALIPVIVEALKDQRLEIEKQREQIKQLVKLIDIKSINEKVFEENEIESIPLLLQNTPNPFNQITEIGYYVPENINSANIYIYDINGFQQRNISISGRGKGATTLQASALQAGIYFYTLICDGKPVDTKQMILTR